MTIKSTRLFIITLIFSLMSLSALAQSPVAVRWTMGVNGAQPGRYSSRFTIKNVGTQALPAGWKLYFNQFARKMTLPPDAPVTIECVKSNYFYIAPTAAYKPLAPGDSIVLDYLQTGTFSSICYGPDGGHFAFEGAQKPIPVAIAIDRLDNPLQWAAKGKEPKNYPDGAYIYDLNASINPPKKKMAFSPYDIIPAPKSVKMSTQSLKIPAAVAIVGGDSKTQAYLTMKLKARGIRVMKTAKLKITLSIASLSQPVYRLDVSPRGIAIEGGSPEALLNGAKTLVAALANAGASLPCVAIEDYPDMAYRGMMLDLARNYIPFSSLKNFIDILASYKINKFQLHFNDDEAWRLEMPSIPELTSIGSRKGMTADEHDCLIQTYAGNGNPDDLSTSANGFITSRQFVELLRYADGLGVEIIPEIETPGHARAAIVSLKGRYAKYINTDPEKARFYKVWDETDTSKYLSAQDYPDNVLNIAQPGTYNFVFRVIDDLAAMYAEAGMKLNTVHLGGDEVASSAWDYSPVVHAFMKQNAMTGVHQLVEYYMDKVTAYLQSKDIKAAGWQEVALKHAPEYTARITPRFSYVSVWSTMGRNDSIPYHVANLGYPTVLCNVQNFYLDIMYNRHQYERGLNWGGTVDEFSSFNALPFSTYKSIRYDGNGQPIDLAKIADGKPALINPANVIGVQAELWTETVRSYSMLQYYVFPKIFGLVERGWNASPAWAAAGDANDPAYLEARAGYNLKIGKVLLPALKARGCNFRIGQPGIVVRDGRLFANTQYPGVVVRYTLDGSEPTAASPAWRLPVNVGSARVVKAKAFYLGKESLTSYLFR